MEGSDEEDNLQRAGSINSKPIIQEDENFKTPEPKSNLIHSEDSARVQGINATVTSSSVLGTGIGQSLLKSNDRNTLQDSLDGTPQVESYRENKDFMDARRVSKKVADLNIMQQLVKTPLRDSMAMDLNFDADEKIDEEREDDKDKEVKKAERKAKREAKDKAKRPILWALMICAVIANTSYLNAVALLPVYIANNFGDKINDTMIGILLAGYSIGFIIAAPCVGTSLSKIGRRKAILIGMLLMALATCLFACAAYFTDPWVFYSISLLGRLGQGIADSLICIALPSVIQIEFPKKAELYYGYWEMANGVGLTLGPVLSSAVNSFTGYSGTFFFFGAAIAILGVITVYTLLPQRLDGVEAEPEEEKDENAEDELDLPKPVTWCIFFTNRRSGMASFVCFMSCLCMQFYDPILSNQFIAVGVPEAFSGWGFTVNCFTYSFGSLAMGILCTKWERRHVVLLSCGICAISLFLLGPAGFLHLPDNKGVTIAIMFTALSTLGIGVAGLTVPIMPEMVESVMEEEYGIASPEEDDDDETSEEEETDPIEAEICDKASTIYNISYASGCAVAPILGGFISGKYGFSECVTFFALLATGLFVFYLIVGVFLHTSKGTTMPRTSSVFFNKHNNKAFPVSRKYNMANSKSRSKSYALSKEQLTKSIKLFSSDEQEDLMASVSGRHRSVI